MNDDGFFKGWFVFCAFIGLAVLLGAGWAVYELVTWVTSK